MYYTNEQFNELSVYEQNFFYAIKTQTTGNSVHPITKGQLKRIAEIHREATGSHIKVNAFCGECAVRILRIVGASYFADKEEREERANAEAVKHEVATSEETPAPMKKTVKTATKSPKKKASTK